MGCPDRVPCRGVTSARDTPTAGEGWPADLIDRVRLAHLFLTRIRLGASGEVTPARFARAVVVFPLVGVTVGVVGGAARLLADPLGAVFASIAAVAATVVTTGALHEDGLADTADAFGPYDRERRLAAMRDSRLGTFGVLALVITIAARVSLLSQLPLRDCVLALIAGHVLARWSTLPLAARCPPAREDGSATLARISTRQAAGGSVLAAALAVPALVAVRPAAAIALAVVAAVTTACAVLWRRAFGGVTGDTYGATNQLVEIAALATVAAVA